jgi:hypothetical protein
MSNPFGTLEDPASYSQRWQSVFGSMQFNAAPGSISRCSAVMGTVTGGSGDFSAAPQGCESKQQVNLILCQEAPAAGVVEQLV